MSCGGIEAMDMSDDPRVGHIGVFNSGYREAPEKAANITKPIFFFLGGESDIAYVNVSDMWIVIQRFIGMSNNELGRA